MASSFRVALLRAKQLVLEPSPILAAGKPTPAGRESKAIDATPSTLHLAPDPDKSTPRVVTAVRVHRDGEWLATAGDDHLVRIFSLADGSQVHRLDKHTDWVRSVDFSPNGKELASAGNDRRIHLWN